MPRAARTPLICALLVAAIWGIYGQVGHYELVDFDDLSYVTDNPHVNSGATVENVRWAFTHAYDGYWAPLTWVSYMIDTSLFESSSGAYHLTNVALHAATSCLVFAVFFGMTRRPWPSAIVAALFAVHPLHVESVAWVAERKDVLSGFFWFLTIWLYVRYVRRPGGARYALVFLSFACGLMAKPIVVTLPFILLLLDVWPLGRLPMSASWPDTSDRRQLRVAKNRRGGPDPAAGDEPLSRTRLLLEKAPAPGALRRDGAHHDLDPEPRRCRADRRCHLRDDSSGQRPRLHGALSDPDGLAERAGRHLSLPGCAPPEGSRACLRGAGGHHVRRAARLAAGPIPPGRMALVPHHPAARARVHPGRPAGARGSLHLSVDDRYRDHGGVGPGPSRRAPPCDRARDRRSGLPRSVAVRSARVAAGAVPGATAKRSFAARWR